MPDYQKGKIYKISSPNSNKIFIGCTCVDKLGLVLSNHKLLTSNYKSRSIIVAGDPVIELVELYKCNNRIELNKRQKELKKFYNSI